MALDWSEIESEMGDVSLRRLINTQAENICNYRACNAHYIVDSVQVLVAILRYENYTASLVSKNRV